MKRYFTLILLVSYFFANSQCPQPSNLMLTYPFLASAQLNWIETGTASAWEVAIIPDYVVGTALPVSGGYLVSNSTFTFTNLPPGCYVFCVRSSCGPNVFSPWSIIASLNCSTNVYTYIASLSNDNFLLDSENDNFKIYPNPSQNVLKLQCNSIIDEVIISDSLGKVILTQTQNNTEINIESLSKGFYFIEAISGNEKFSTKFIKE
ncbi:T9SS type A sorting domain-containing protein [Flavobacterium sp. SUN052]|uniref:T9SS type A sorting domain-containing protein n=1 Tax=Flavobacterium sp. SUN052 TaxID=3002441 RepID=UPI00237DCD45|nr:T9SS type A sorting domain-containing protein [Flavobacterium sp. SUN052]MEC4005741.1 T9SS type A sorting domain-containing protein [Flavobacterium sp. SUN052]